MQAAAIGLVVECDIFDASPSLALLVAKVPHGSEKEREPAAVLRDIVGLLADLHLQDRILPRIEAVERRRLSIELIPENDHEVAQGHVPAALLTIVSTRCVAECTIPAIAAVSGMFRQYFFGI